LGLFVISAQAAKNISILTAHYKRISNEQAYSMFDSDIFNLEIRGRHSQICFKELGTDQSDD
jgi:hypothetical protein